MILLVYQAYGLDDIVNEALYSILSLLDQQQRQDLPPDVRLLIYTDRAEAFENVLGGSLTLEYVPITAENLRRWRGDIDFVHRVKIEVLQDAAARYPHAHLLYLDSDTVFDRPVNGLLQLLRSGRLIMHRDEGCIGKRGNPHLRRLSRFLASEKGRAFAIPQHHHMWNAGVLGIPSTYVHLLSEALALTDRLHPVFPRHMVEQLAFCHLFQKEMPIASAETDIHHYWHFKEFRQMLRLFFARYGSMGLDTLVRQAGAIHPAVARAPKTRYENIPKFIRKITGIKWKLPEV